jgi:hypothetical protein
VVVEGGTQQVQTVLVELPQRNTKILRFENGWAFPTPNPHWDCMCDPVSL